MAFHSKDTFDDSTPASEEQNNCPSSFPGRQIKSFLIVFLSVLCVIGGILIHRIHSKSLDSYPSFPSLYTEPEKPSFLNITPPTKSDTVMTLPENGSTSQASLSPVIPPQTETNPTPFLTEEPQEIPVPEKSLLLSQPLSQKTVLSSDEKAAILAEKFSHELTEETSENSPSLEKKLPLLDVLNMQDAFLHADTCQKELSDFSQKAQHLPEARETLVYLSSFCSLRKNPTTVLKEIFLKNKKAALTAAYKEKYPAWLAYLKSLQTVLWDIHEISPKGNKPKDVINKAQTALNKGNLNTALAELSRLPLHIKTSFSPFFQEAAAYNRAKESLNRLILSYE